MYVMECIGNLKVISTFKTVTFSIEPTKEQFNSFARRVMPDIKVYFDDKQVQKDFTLWQEEQVST
jgi:hypothetical protein